MHVYRNVEKNDKMSQTMLWFWEGSKTKFHSTFIGNWLNQTEKLRIGTWLLIWVGVCNRQAIKRGGDEVNERRWGKKRGVRIAASTQGAVYHPWCSTAEKNTHCWIMSAAVKSITWPNTCLFFHNSPSAPNTGPGV